MRIGTAAFLLREQEVDRDCFLSPRCIARLRNIFLTFVLTEGRKSIQADLPSLEIRESNICLQSVRIHAERVLSYARGDRIFVCSCPLSFFPFLRAFRYASIDEAEM